MVENYKFFYSKILLFGEYTVTLGSGALAIPYNGFNGRFNFNTQNKIIDKGLQLIYDTIISNSNLQKLFHHIQFKTDLKNGLYFHSDIPRGYGLGSSGAVVAAFYDQYALNKTENIKDLKVLLAKIECAFHGSSSGIDPLVSYLGKPLRIKDNGNIQIIDLPIHNTGFFLIDTGIPRQTGSLVEHFNSKLINNKLFLSAVKELAEQNQKGMTALLDDDKKELMRSMKRISQLQYDHFSEMIPDAFRTIWLEGLNHNNYFLKLCGAGGGGMIMGWAEDVDTLISRLPHLSVIKL